MLGHVAAHVSFDVVFGDVLAFFFDHDGEDFFAVGGVGNADDLDVFDGRMGVDEILDLLGIEVFAAADDHVLDPAGDAIVAVVVTDGEVAGVQPAVAVDRSGCGLRHFVISLHDVVAAGDEFTGDAVGDGQIGRRIDDAAFDAGQFAADGANLDLDRVFGTALGAAGRALGLAKDDRDLIHVHAVDDLLHDLDRAGGSGHDASPHVREVSCGEVGMLEQGDEHRWYAMQGGAVLPVDRLEDLAGLEIFQRHHGRAVGDGGEGSQDEAETMEQRYGDDQLVIG